MCLNQSSINSKRAEFRREYISDLNQYIKGCIQDLNYFIPKYKENIFNEKRHFYSKAIKLIKATIKKEVEYKRKLQVKIEPYLTQRRKNESNIKS